jgi:hypothetical protein
LNTSAHINAGTVPADKLEIIKNLDHVQRPEIQWAVPLDFVYLLLFLFVLSSLFSFIQGWINDWDHSEQSP